MADELPPVVTRLTGDVTDLEAALGRGQVAVEAFHDKVTGLGGGSSGIGEEIGRDIGDGIGDGLGKELPKATDPPLEDFDDKVKKRTQSTAEAAGKGMSPLLLAAFVGAATIGPAAILAGAATAVTGVAALVAGSNAQVAHDYANLGQIVKSTITNAVSPITGDVDAAVTVLGQGITQLGPQMDELFAAVGPDAVELASGLNQLAQGVLPGILAGVRAIAPEMHTIADDIGKLGQGVGGLIGGLGVGASGSTTAFTALSTALSEILPDLGQVIGTLSNGLGPALADIVPLIDGAAKGVTVLTGALSPGEIQTAALAFAGLFAVFKGASWTGLLQEGTKFTQFLGGAAKTSTEAEGAIKSLATKGVGALSAALDVATGPLGLIIAGAGLLGNELGKLSGVGDHTAANVDALASAMGDAANGSARTQGQIDELANAFEFMSTGPLHAADGLKSMDEALVKLNQANPQQAAQEFAMLSKSLEANGVSSADVAKDFPQYTQAVEDAKLQSHLLGTQTDQLTQSLITAGQSAHDAAQKTAEQTLAALGAVDGQNKLNLKLDDTITAYETATGQASAYKTALDAMYGKYQGYSQAQATFTTDVDNAAKSLTHGKDAIDLNSAAGAANFTLLSQLATQNENVAEALLKQTGNQNAANKSLQDGALKIDALAKSSGFTDTQIQQLNKDLYGTASIKDISVTVSANTDAAYSGVDQLLSYVNSSGATIHVYEYDGTVSNSGSGVKARAGGGPVVKGETYWVGEKGVPELFTAGANGFITPSDMLKPATVAPGGVGGGAAPVVVNVYLDGKLVTGGVRSSAQQYKTRNAQTGLT